MDKDHDEHVDRSAPAAWGLRPFTFVSATPVHKVREGGRVEPVHVLDATVLNAGRTPRDPRRAGHLERGRRRLLAFFRDLTARGVGVKPSPAKRTAGPWSPRSARPLRVRHGNCAARTTPRT